MVMIPDWSGREIEAAQSSGGVYAVVDPWDNVIHTGIRPWPPPELVQKLYQSRQERAYVGANLEAATRKLGYYSDLQSLHSEDSITWRVFGPLVYASPQVRNAFVQNVLQLIDVPGGGSANVWLWRRVAHPDTLVPGGPEIDFGIQTDEVLVLGEAKWRSAVGRAQGVNQDKDQLTLRREFCEKIGRRILPGCRYFVVLGLSAQGGMVSKGEAEPNGATLLNRDTTWHAIANLPGHPCGDELRAYLKWKEQYSKAI